MDSHRHNADAKHQPGGAGTHAALPLTEKGASAPGSGMFRRIALLSSSATVAQLMLLAISPILSRMYVPADFAMFAFFQSALSVLSLALTLQFEQAITLPESKRDAETVRRLALRTALGLTLVMSAVGAGLSWTGRLNGLWLTPVLICLLPFCSLAEAYARTYRVDAVRDAAFRRMSVSRVLLSVGTGIGQIGCFLIGLKSVGLILGDGFGRWLSIVPFLLGRREVVPPAPPSVSFATAEPVSCGALGASRSMAELACEYRKFPFYLTPAAVLALLVNVAPALLLPGLYGEEFAGQFALANRSILLPFLVISQAVTHVYVSDASRMIRNRESRLPELLRRTAAQLACIGGLLALGAALAGPFLFPVVFGSRWSVSGELVPLLAISGFAQFVGGPLNQVLILTREEGRKLAMNLTGLASIATVLWTASRFHLTGYQAIACYAVTVLLIQSLYVFQSFTASRQQVARWAREEGASLLPPMAA